MTVYESKRAGVYQIYSTSVVAPLPGMQSPLFTREGVVFKVSPSVLPLTVGHGSVVVEVSPKEGKCSVHGHSPVQRGQCTVYSGYGGIVHMYVG